MHNKTLLTALAVLAFAVGLSAQWSVGFDFRETSTYVTDPTGYTYEIATTADYPTTRIVNGNSVTFGWEVANDGSRDRTTGEDARLAGIAFAANNLLGTQRVFRIDLPATGAYTITGAWGDNANPQYQWVGLQDSSTPFATYTGTATAINSFMDAAGNVWTAAAWPGSNVAVSHTFSSTIFRVTENICTVSTNCSINTVIASIQITASGSPPVTMVPRHHGGTICCGLN